MRRAFADSRLAVTLRRWRARFGVSAPKVAVRTHVAWYWRALTWTAVLSVSLALGGWVYDAGRRIGGFDQRDAEREQAGLRERVAALDKELTGLRAIANSSESSLAIERTAQQQLARQVRQLEEENARLKEEIAFFENLAAAEGQEAGFTINRLRVERDVVPEQYRFRILAAAQGGRKDREFKGSYQLVVKLEQDGKSAMMFFPAAEDPNRQRYNISFKHFQRIDGIFKVPENARVASVEVRLVQEGKVRATQVVTL